MNLQELRTNYPQYNDMSDEQLVTNFHKKYYSDVPFEEFSQKIGYRSAQRVEWTPEMQAKYEAMNIPQGSVAGGALKGTLMGLGHGIERLANGLTLGGYGWLNRNLGGDYDKRKQFIDEAGLAGKIAGTGTEIVGGILPFVATGGTSTAAQGTGALAKVGSVANKLNYARPINAFTVGRTGIASSVPYLGKAVSGAEGIARGGLAGASLAGISSGFNNDFDVESIKNDTEQGAYLGMAFPAAGVALRGVGNLAGFGLGASTGTGNAVKQAFQAGKRKSSVFLDNMRKDADPFEVVNLAKTELSKKQAALSNEYKKGINTIFKDEQKIDIRPLIKSYYDLAKDLSYKGFSKADDATRRVMKKISDVLNEFAHDKSLHTPEGLDALKRRIGDISLSLDERGAMRVKDAMYNNVSKLITEKAPGYSTIMKQYAKGQEAIRQIESSLGMGGNKAPETALKKLQSVFKNDRGSSWGARSDLAKGLNTADNRLLDSLAGQALSSYMPRGLYAGLGGMGATLSSVGSGLSPLGIASLPAFSPRLVGEAVYGLGRGASKLDPELLRKLFYGTIDNLLSKK